MPSLCSVCTGGIQTSSKHMGASIHIQGTSKHRGVPYVWMPPVHTQYKENMLCQTKGVSICPIHLDSPISLDTSICLDAPCMFGHPHMFGCPLYIHNTKKACFVRLRGCPYAPIHVDSPVHQQHKERMFCQTKGVSICPHTFGCPQYVWMPPICLDALHMFGCPTVCLDAAKCMVASKGMRDIQTYGGVQMYRGI